MVATSSIEFYLMGGGKLIMCQSSCDSSTFSSCHEHRFDPNHVIILKTVWSVCIYNHGDNASPCLVMTAANTRLGAPHKWKGFTRSYKTTLNEIHLVQLSFKLNCTKHIWPHVKAAVTAQHSAAAINFRFFENWPTRSLEDTAKTAQDHNSCPFKKHLKSFPNIQYWLSMDKSVGTPSFIEQSEEKMEEETPPTGGNTPIIHPSSSSCEKVTDWQKIVKGWEAKGQTPWWGRIIGKSLITKVEMCYHGDTYSKIITLLSITSWLSRYTILHRIKARAHKNGWLESKSM